NSRKVDLLDNARLLAQLVSLERRTGRGTGKDSIDHPPGPSSHDDIANCVAGVVAELARGSGYDSTLSWVGGVGVGSDSYPTPEETRNFLWSQYWTPPMPFIRGSMRRPR